MSSVAAFLHAWSPILAPFFTIATLITCIIITKVNDTYVGTLSWPYFSDMGRGMFFLVSSSRVLTTSPPDVPAAYVFAIGLCLTAIFLALTWFFNYTYQKTVLAHPSTKGASSAALPRCSLAVCIMGMISTIGLPILSIYRVSFAHPEIHNYAAYFFFVFQAAAVLLNTYVTRRLLVIHQSLDADAPPFKLDSLRRAWRFQIAFAVAFSIAFLLYIPVGLAIVCDWARLTIQKCIENGLGVDYCQQTIRLDDVNTKLYDYGNCWGINQMRAAAQLACILTLVGYAFSFRGQSADM
ncbi:Aste57867_21233 [Aphanomyces stellatus]|uniref:Aste57867_21233 protein n=1 Tax=Aphanomyces stellatus TaxID=120398 RepID=A0A485LH19_9STRA|nr:hypothetical protein As57867_021165 [Aphanomyces stellatus]VFT97905.1 Aste57867_21233 [Aphanomyces stellatus]